MRALWTSIKLLFHIWSFNSSFQRMFMRFSVAFMRIIYEELRRVWLSRVYSSNASEAKAFPANPRGAQKVYMMSSNSDIKRLLFQLQNLFTSLWLSATITSTVMWQFKCIKLQIAQSQAAAFHDALFLFVLTENR